MAAGVVLKSKGAISNVTWECQGPVLDFPSSSQLFNSLLFLSLPFCFRLPLHFEHMAYRGSTDPGVVNDDNNDDPREFEGKVEVIEGDINFEEESNSECDSDNESIPDDSESVLVRTPDYVYRRHTGAVFCGKMNDKKIVTGGEDDIAVIWNKSSKNIVDVIPFTDSVVGVDFSYDGEFVCMGDMKGVVQVREMENDRIVFATELGIDMMWLKWHPKMYTLFIGTSEGDVLMYNIPEGDCQVLPGHGHCTECGAISGNIAVIGYSDGLIRIFDTSQTKALHTVSLHGHLIVCLDLLEERNLIAVGDNIGGVSVIARNRGQVIAHFNSVKPTGSEPDVGENTVVSVESVICLQPLLPDNSPLVAAGNLMGYLCVWDVSREILRYMVKFNEGITKLLQQDHFIFVACLKGKIYKLDGRTGQIAGKFQGHSRDVLDICLSVDGSELLSTADDKLVCMFTLQQQ